MTVTNESVQAKLAKAQDKLARLERRLDGRRGVRSVKTHIRKLELSSAYLKSAPREYYQRSWAWRGRLLGCAVPHLCKSIIVENTACTSEDTKDSLNSRYYCIVLQYNSKLNTEELQRFIRNQIPEKDRPGRKAYNFQHAAAEKAHELTGFSFNAVSPYGMKTLMPVIVSDAVAAVEPSFIWLGGGAENVKLRISVPELLKSLDAVVAPGITTLREETEKKETHDQGKKDKKEKRDKKDKRERKKEKKEKDAKKPREEGKKQKEKEGKNENENEKEKEKEKEEEREKEKEVPEETKAEQKEEETQK